MHPELLKLNQQLCESRHAIPVRETCEAVVLEDVPPGSYPKEHTVRIAAERVVEEGKAKGKLHSAKVGQADKPNQNRRVYTRSIWENQVKRFKEKKLLDEGRLCGSVNHLGMFEGGNLDTQCILWREVWIDDKTGGVFGRYEIVEKHSAGADLKAQHEAGMAIGFSTFGYGTAHEPSEEEEEKYSDGKRFVVMDENYTCKKIDAVDDPSVEDAWKLEALERAHVAEHGGIYGLLARERQDHRTNQPGQTGEGSPARRESTNPTEGVPAMKTLAEAKAAGSPIWSEHETAVNAEKAKTTDASNKLAEVTKERDTLLANVNKLVEGVKPVGGVNLPQKEVMQAEFAEKLSAETAKRVQLEGQVATLTAEKTSVAAERDAFKGKVETAEKTAAQAQRKTKVREAFEAAIKDKPAIKAAASKLLEKRLDAEDFTAESVAALVAEATELAKLFGAKPGKPGKGPETGMRGEDSQDDGDDVGESNDDDEIDGDRYSEDDESSDEDGEQASEQVDRGEDHFEVPEALRNYGKGKTKNKGK